jgi:hypothetical protein
MKLIVFSLSLIGAALAQSVSDAGGASSTDSGSAPIAPTPAPTIYDPSLYTGSFVPPSTPTAAPTDFYQIMPYSMYQNGGYQILECGYGYSKQPDGSCTPDSWVRPFWFFLDFLYQ